MSFASREELSAFVEALKPNAHLAIIYGGESTTPGTVIQETRNCRPWKSYREVAETIAQSLASLGFAHVRCLPDDIHLLSNLREHKIDLAWLNTGGVQGRNPMAHAAAMLELAGIPYVGHDPLNVSRLDNKHVFKRELAWLGLPTPAFTTWTAGMGPFDPEAPTFLMAFPDCAGPFVVKPATGRGSLYVHVVDRVAGLAQAIAAVQAATRHTVLIERFVGGREFCVAVMGHAQWRGSELSRATRPIAFSAVERVLPAGERVAPSLDRQPLMGRLLGQDGEDGRIQQQLHTLAESIYAGFDLEFMVRIDARMDEQGKLHVLEANPKPDLTRDPKRPSLATIGLAALGMDYDDLTASLLTDRLAAALEGRDLGFASLFSMSGRVIEQRVATVSEPVRTTP